MAAPQASHVSLDGANLIQVKDTSDGWREHEG